MMGTKTPEGPAIPRLTSSKQRQAAWNPFWLRRAWLGAYACLFSSLAAATLALYLISHRNNGLHALRIATETVYFWKYCPTAGTWTALQCETLLTVSKFLSPCSHSGILSITSPGCFSLGQTCPKAHRRRARSYSISSPHCNLLSCTRQLVTASGQSYWHQLLQSR